MQVLSASEQIDNFIKGSPDWRGRTLARLRKIILGADPRIFEEVKWKKPSKPEGVPVWSYNGMICVADTLKSAVRLTFPKGAKVPDPDKLFNTRLTSSSVRAIDFFADVLIDESALKALILEVMQLNQPK